MSFKNLFQYNRYFPERKGLVSGVISGGFGFGATVFIWLVYALVNPGDEKPTTEFHGNKYYSEKVCENLPKTIQVLGILYFAISFIGALLIEEPTQEEIAEINNKQKEQARLQNDFNYDKKNECQSLKDGLKTPLIYLTGILTAMYACFGAMIVANYKSYGQTFSYSDSYLSAIGTAGSVANGLSRFFWGGMLEKITYKQLVAINLSLQIIISLTLRWVSQYQVVYFIYIILAYFMYGGWYAVQPATITKIYGKKIGTTIYGLTFTGFTIAGWVQFFVVKIVQDAVGWGNMFMIFTGVQVCAFLITLLVKYEINWGKKYSNDDENAYTSQSLMNDQ